MSKERKISLDKNYHFMKISEQINYKNVATTMDSIKVLLNAYRFIPWLYDFYSYI